MNDRILCVDDDPNVLAAFQRNLRRRFTIETAVGGEEALGMVRNHGPYAVIVADMNMPGMNGIQLLKWVREAAPETVRIMLTGNADQQTAMEAINQGHIFRFFTKPCSPELLASGLEAGLEQYRLVTSERELLEKTLNGSIKMLTEILSMVEPQFFGRGQRMRDYARLLAPALNVTQIWELEMAALLAQIGYVTVPAAIVQKDRNGLTLAASEKQILARIPEIGQKLLSHIPRLEKVAKILLYQNKYFDGSGFPQDSVAGEDIPIGSRILRVLSDFVQQEFAGAPRSEILDQMRTRPGAYDPKIIDAAMVTLVQDPTAIQSGQAVSAKDLCTGQVLLSPVQTTDGFLILPAGTRLSPMLLEKIRNFADLSGIREPIYINR
jgi:response regulator RpfG family c-di-GMP phosphodiesterase